MPAAVSAPEADAPTTSKSSTTRANAATSSTATNRLGVVSPRWAEGTSDELFDDSALHTFAIEVAPEDLERLDADPGAETYVEGRFAFNGEFVESVGVRYKGSIGGFLGCTSGSPFPRPTGAKTCTKLSLQLKINWSDPKRRFYGVRRVQLHAQNLDDTKMHERLGYWLFREMGVAAPRSTHARVNVNGTYLGVFGLTEEVDGRFTRDAFDEGSGNLYKEVWPFDGNGRPQTAERLIDALVTNEDGAPSPELMLGFAKELDAASPAQLAAVVERWVDVENLLTHFVVDRAIAHDDGPLHWYCRADCEPHNFYWYEDPTTRRLTLIPWDLDNAFARWESSRVAEFTAIADPIDETRFDCAPFPYGSFGLPQRSAACDPLVAAIVSRRAEYDAIRRRFLDGPFAAARVAERLATWSAQIEDAMADAAVHDDAPSVESWRGAIAALEDGLAVARTSDGR
jgi:spore coat protein CotH